jgi:hypothetical protein
MSKNRLKVGEAGRGCQHNTATLRIRISQHPSPYIPAPSAFPKFLDYYLLSAQFENHTSGKKYIVE